MNSIITLLRSILPPFTTILMKRYPNPINAVIPDNITLLFSFSDGVSFHSTLHSFSPIAPQRSLSCKSSSSPKRAGSTENVLSGAGCISVFTTVSAAMMANAIIRLYVAKIVCEIGIALVIVPLETSTKEAPSVAIAKGIEAERPECQTTNPLYADAIRSL